MLGLPPSADPAAEIEAELRDHLATAADRLQQQGLPPAAAQQKAQENFGDLTAISRRCYWIKQGDTIMFRWAVIGLLSILCVALGITALGSWRSQTQMADQMASLAEQLKMLAENQKGAPTAIPLEITGKVYLGSPDKPATNTEVMICRVGDGEIVRRLSTSQSGAYRSGPLAEGDYTVLAKEPKDAPPPQVGFQSAPVYLYPGTAKATVDFDVGQPKAQVAVRHADPLPRLVVEGKYVIDSRLYFRVEPLGIQPIRWTARSPMPERWPLYIQSPETSVDPAEKSAGRRVVRSYFVVGGDDLSSGMAPVNFPGSGDLLIPGPYRVTASVVADIKPDDQSDVVSPPFPPSRGEPMKWMSAEWVLAGYMGGVWLNKLYGQQTGGGSRPNFGYRDRFGGSTSASTVVELKGGMVTQLHIEIPSDVVSRIQNLAETITDYKDFAAAVLKEQPFVREAKVTVVETEAPTGELAQ